MALWNKVFNESDGYRPSPTVTHRLDKSTFDLDQLEAVLVFATAAIREERRRLEMKRACSPDHNDELHILPVWPEAA